MSTLTRFDTETNRSFWDANQSDYFGARHSETIIFFSHNYIGKKILDAGAGDGSMVRLLRQRFPEADVQGIDLAPKNDDVVAGDLTQMPYADGQFDTVFCMEVIEHVPTEDIQAILRDAYRVLAPGGSMILTTPYAEALEKAEVECPHCKTIFHRYGHQQSFQESDVASLFAGAGFTDIEVFPVKMSRVRRYKLLGPNFFKTKFMRKQTQKMRGKLNLIALAKKP